MAIEKVRKYFEQYGMEQKILEFDTSSATVELAAMAVGCEPKRIADAPRRSGGKLREHGGSRSQ